MRQRSAKHLAACPIYQSPLVVCVHTRFRHREVLHTKYIFMRMLNILTGILSGYFARIRSASDFLLSAVRRGNERVARAAGKERGRREVRLNVEFVGVSRAEGGRTTSGEPRDTGNRVPGGSQYSVPVVDS